MKRMSLLIAVSLCLSFSQASVYKGQKEYMKKCKKCHGNGGKLAETHTTDEWEKLFENKGALLILKHDNNATASKYFHSKRFKKKAKHLLHFFKKYASDSGNVPACSD
ncbi:hypothetical protein [Nitratiruptor sp. SB155-2]|uniref:hypothetical protein n=1 Tax=Nitratiruptor sp. (strain SB155-2) TaxID=387092 RepID=UPI0001586E1F|nr:hypothetical protein [Nitratiruptor sp. SB155-2]BAF69770.1 conserved hypothetical protein [Nitratiruptor sp. SB155-2]